VALRRDEVLVPSSPGVVVPFPADAARRRARRARMLARRRRAAVAAAGLLLAAAAGWSASGEQRVASAPGSPGSVVLAPGETLWELARRHAARGTDPRAYVDALQDLNRVRSAPAPGRSLRLPEEVSFLGGDP
jgi:hypothetical protein